MQEGDEKAAGAGAEVQDTKGRVPVRKEPERGLHHGLGIGARDEGFVRETEGQPPEFGFAEEAGDGFAGQAAPPEGAELFNLVGGERLVGTGREVGGADAERAEDEKPGVERGRIEPGRRKGQLGIASSSGRNRRRL